MKSPAVCFRQGDVLYGRLRPYLNKVALPNFDGLASGEFIVLPGTECVSNSFLKHRLSAADFVSFASHLNEGDRPRVSFDQIGQFRILIPHPREQRRIVAKIEELLSELDEGIQSLKTARIQLAIYRQAMLKHAFEGRLTAQWREENEDGLEEPEQLLARVQQERVKRYERKLRDWKTAATAWDDQGRRADKPRRPSRLPTVAGFSRDVIATLPRLSDSWVWGRLAWMTCGVEYGTAAKSAPSGEVPVLRMGNIRGAEFDWSDLVFTSNRDEIERYLLHDGDVLVNRTNSPELVGKTAIYRGNRQSVFAGYLIRINHIQSVVDGQYLNLFLNSRVARHYGSSVKTDGSTNRTSVVLSS